MNIVPLNLFKLLKPKRSRMATMLERKNEQQEEKDAQQVVNASGYTLVDMVIPGGRRLDMMTSGHSLAKHIDKNRSAQGSAKARWQPMKNEQHYNPNTIKPDAQLEFNVKRQGLIEVPREVVLEQLDEIPEEDWILEEQPAVSQGFLFEEKTEAKEVTTEESVAEQLAGEKVVADQQSTVEGPVAESVKEEASEEAESPESPSEIETPSEIVAPSESELSFTGLIVEDQVFQSI